jgi:glucosamine-6-phosphate deaminase
MAAMAIEIVADETALAQRAADIVCDVVARKPDAVLGLPTGSTPVGTYFELSRRSDTGACDTRRTTAFAIDEFLGVPRLAPGTNSAFFRQYLRVPLRALHIPNSAAQDPEEHISAFAAAVKRAGGMDLCLLGIGTNGHVAFNEPGSAADSRAGVVDLCDETRRAHAPTFGSAEAVPGRGLTLGIADVMEARALLVLAAGARKAPIVARALEGAQSVEVPASWLRDHPAITWLLAEDAASALRRG